MKRKPLVTTFCIGLLVALGACSDSSTDPPVAAILTLSPTTLTFSSFGDTKQLTPTVFDENGTMISCCVRYVDVL